MVAKFSVGAPLTYNAIQRTNLHPNPKAGVDLTNLQGNASAGSIAFTRVSGAGGPIAEITTWARVQTTTAVSTYMDVRNRAGALPINPAITYNFSSYLRPTSASSATAAQFVLWYAEDGVTLLATSTNPSTPSLPNITWTRVEYQVSSPNPAAVYAVYVSRSVSGTTFPIGDRLDATGFLIEAI